MSRRADSSQRSEVSDQRSRSGLWGVHSGWAPALLLCGALAGIAQEKPPARAPAADTATTSRSGGPMIARPVPADAAAGAAQAVDAPDSAGSSGIADANAVPQAADTAAAAALQADTSRVKTPLPAAKKEPPRKIKLIKHDFNFREQIVMAVCMMFFVVLMMNTAQALNPD